MPLSTVEHTPTPSSSTLSIAVTDTLPPLPKIQSAQTREQIFTHSSLTARRRGEFEAPQDNPSRDNEELAHIGDQVVSLAVTDLIQSHYPRLRVGSTSANQKLRDRIKCGAALAEITVKYGLHESLRTQAPSLKASQSVQGGIFREKGMDVVKHWLDPLFRPLLDVAYQEERRDHLVQVPGPAAPATTPRTPNSARKRRRASLRDGDADAPDTGYTDRPTKEYEEAAPVKVGWRGVISKEEQAQELESNEETHEERKGDENNGKCSLVQYYHSFKAQLMGHVCNILSHNVTPLAAFGGWRSVEDLAALGDRTVGSITGTGDASCAQKRGLKQSRSCHSWVGDFP
ncbi:hypothetical protein BJY52DRAFT_1357840 [Lactarius psammicola]|nr:hypothetical protein BJY52DRAFT_1357840 [Lactarius psammicola]